MYLTITQNKRWLENTVVFLFCFAVIFGPAYALFDSYDYDMVANPDLETYLGLANFDFDQSPIRKYRVIVPLIASGLDYLFGGVLEMAAPNFFPGPDFSMCLSFLLINSVFMSIFGLLIYLICKEYGATIPAAILAVLTVLTSRWTAYFAGIPIVDSLYLVIIGLTILGIKIKNVPLVTLAIFIGPWAKESFIFVAPLIFFFSSIKKWKQILLFAASAFIVFSFRYFFDKSCDISQNIGLSSDFEHVRNVSAALKRLFSFHGIYEMFSILGFWNLLFIFLIKKEVRLTIIQSTSLFTILFFIVIFVHAILSTELYRMFYLATPVLAVWIALIYDSATSEIKQLGIFVR